MTVSQHLLELQSQLLGETKSPILSLLLISGPRFLLPSFSAAILELSSLIPHLPRPSDDTSEFIRKLSLHARTLQHLFDQGLNLSCLVYLLRAELLKQRNLTMEWFKEDKTFSVQNCHQSLGTGKLTICPQTIFPIMYPVPSLAQGAINQPLCHAQKMRLIPMVSEPEIILRPPRVLGPQSLQTVLIGSSCSQRILLAAGSPSFPLPLNNPCTFPRNPPSGVCLAVV